MGALEVPDVPWLGSGQMSTASYLQSFYLREGERVGDLPPLVLITLMDIISVNPKICPTGDPLGQALPFY